MILFKKCNGFCQDWLLFLLFLQTSFQTFSWLFSKWRVMGRILNGNFFFSVKPQYFRLKLWILKENEKILRLYKIGFKIRCKKFICHWISCLKISWLFFEIWQLCQNSKNAKFQFRNLQKIHFPLKFLP